MAGYLHLHICLITMPYVYLFLRSERLLSRELVPSRRFLLTSAEIGHIIILPFHSMKEQQLLVSSLVGSRTMLFTVECSNNNWVKKMLTCKDCLLILLKLDLFDLFGCCVDISLSFFLSLCVSRAFFFFALVKTRKENDGFSHLRETKRRWQQERKSINLSDKFKRLHLELHRCFLPWSTSWLAYFSSNLPIPLALRQKIIENLFMYLYLFLFLSICLYRVYIQSIVSFVFDRPFFLFLPLARFFPLINVSEDGVSMKIMSAFLNRWSIDEVQLEIRMVAAKENSLCFHKIR